MQSMLLHIGSCCGTQFCPDLSLQTHAANCPNLSCLPHGLAESLLTLPAADINNEGIDFHLQNDFELKVSLLDEFCSVLHCLHACRILKRWQITAYAVAQACLPHLHVTV